jgi:protein gp37
MTKTSISWVLGPDGKPGFSWNPVVGCRAVSPGCEP